MFLNFESKPYILKEPLLTVRETEDRIRREKVIKSDNVLGEDTTEAILDSEPNPNIGITPKKVYDHERPKCELDEIYSDSRFSVEKKGESVVIDFLEPPSASSTNYLMGVLRNQGCELTDSNLVINY